MNKKTKSISKRIAGQSTPKIKSALTKADKYSTAIDTFPIVGIGASAGGLEALESFFKHLPDECNMAFVVIQHLDPTQKGIMPELIQRFTSMEVVPVKDRLKVYPNCVYVIPSNKSMSILRRTLHLFEPIETRGLRLPIDFFFSSLADDQQEHSIGIILSGMGSDGSMGLRAIKEKSGLVLVQEPESAKFDGMPQSAIKAVPVDFIVPANELPEKLVEFLKNKSFIKTDSHIPHKDKSALEKIVILLRIQTGHDFSQYKNNTLYRRIERRMGIHQINRIADYVRFLQENANEVEILFKDLLIGVTNFFRDESVWEQLKDKILPGVFAKLSNGYKFRAWVPGCSTGEEAYSLAMVLKEALEKNKQPKNITLQIFATDLDQDAIEKARLAYYPHFITANVEPSRLNRFFIKTEAGYRINAEIREMVVFAPQNIIKDPPFTKLDFISCRNMLIYMESELQAKLMKLFQYCLNPGGLLLIGNAETLGAQSSLFSTINSKLRIYSCSPNVKTLGLTDFPSSFSNVYPDRTEKRAPTKITDNIQTLADQLLLQQFAPASVMTNNKGDIIYITGRTGNYLEPAAGKANMNIFVMAREGLRNELSVGFRKAMQSYKQVVLHNIKVSINGNTQFVNVTIQKVENPQALYGMFMVVFSDVPAIVVAKSGKSGRKETTDKSAISILETELQRTKEELQLTIEEMQTSHEELNSTNEEVQSTNEELQSTNEELTTSKEEMQSLNEELQTVNIELQSKVDDYIHINNDLKNLFDSTDIATLFLDKNLNIRRFTKQTTEIFKLIQTDIGRPFTDIVSELDYPDIADDAQEVLSTLMFIEKNVITCDHRWFSIRIMPYRTIDDRIDGLVFTFSEITETKKLEVELRKTNEVLHFTNEELKTTNEELLKRESQYRHLLHEKELILKEVHHRIKNNMSIIFSLLKLQADDEINSKAKNTLLDAAERTRSMMLLYDKLYRSENKEQISINEYLPAFIEEIVSIFPQKTPVKVLTQIENIILSAEILSPLGIIINEFVTNSMKYAFTGHNDGVITLTVSKKENRISLIIKDNGPGIPESVNFENSTGFGLQLIYLLVKQINGSITVHRQKGTTFIIEFNA